MNNLMNEKDIFLHYDKLKLALRYYLLGKDYYLAADALEFAANYHSGTRKDKITPEFQHQIEITHYLRTLLPFFQYPEETLTTAILHDVTEDYGVLINVISEKYGDVIAEAVNILDKNGKDIPTYFSNIAGNPIASIVKGGDRIHNIQSMQTVFSFEKQAKYIKEVEEYFLPMLKQARRTFVRQEAAYQNIKHMLVSQIELIRYRLENTKATDTQNDSLSTITTVTTSLTNPPNPVIITVDNNSSNCSKCGELAVSIPRMGISHVCKGKKE